MQVFNTVESLNDYLEGCRKKAQSVALVPTMGGLHEGHLRLINKAKECADTVVASIFVNPTQFARGEDFEQYPQSPEKDIKNLKKRQVDALFMPEIGDIYPQSQESGYDFGELTQILCGISRPTHFNGVVQVVTRFLILSSRMSLFLARKTINNSQSSRNWLKENTATSRSSRCQSTGNLTALQ